MDKIRIRRTASDYVGAINKTQYSNIEIKSTIKPLLYDTNVSKVDLNNVFLEERDKCRTYRVMLALNPYCSNVLFNPCTEIVKNEGSEDVQAITEYNLGSYDKAIGPKAANAFQMIRNTEYSSENAGYNYLPGLDIFNNHILRNKSYRIVNAPKKSTHDVDFNTLSDIFRLSDGTVLEKCCRLDVDDITEINKHLYNADDVLSFSNGDAINENLKENDGWFGFYNNSIIEAKGSDGNSLDISRVINNKGNCQFIDMYPGRDLFNFTPKYNQFRGRLEYNWDICLTYPFESTTIDENGDDIDIVQSGYVNGLLIIDAKYIITPSGGKAVQFRTATKHNLSAGDDVHIYFNEDADLESNVGVWYKCDNDFRVYSTGDANGNYNEYYFSIDNVDLLTHIFCTPKSGENYSEWDYIRDYFYGKNPISMNDVPTFDSTAEYYNLDEIVKYNNTIYICTAEKSGTDRVYSIKKHFSKLNDACNKYSGDTDKEGYVIGLRDFPTDRDHYIKVGNDFYALYNSDMQTSFITASHTTSSEDFIMAIVNNAFRTDDGIVKDDSISTLWCDYISFRVVKVENNIECKYYVRKFKKLPGEYDNEIYKLAFANNIYGDDLAQITYTDDINIDGIVDNIGRDLTDIYVTIVKSNRGYKEWYLDDNKGSSNVEFSHCFGPVTSGFDIFTLPSDNSPIRGKRSSVYDVRFLHNTLTLNESVNLNNNFITINDDWFYGDVVEFSPATTTETVLCDVNFRFNTAQRELGSNEEYVFRYEDIVSDDYDGEFKVNTTRVQLVKHEGYYYKPHYRVRLRGLGDVQQGSHRTVFISKATPYQANGMYIKCVGRVKHRLTQGNNITINDTSTGCVWNSNVVYVINPYTFVISPIDKSDSNYKNWVTVCENLNNGIYKIRVINELIPTYATNIGDNTYIWRNTINLWDEDDSLTLPFANNALYIDDIINLYLKRQNSDRNVTDYHSAIDDIFADTEGLKTDEASNNDYKEEFQYKC